MTDLPPDTFTIFDMDASTPQGWPTLDVERVWRMPQVKAYRDSLFDLPGTMEWRVYLTTSRDHARRAAVVQLHAEVIDCMEAAA